MNFIRNGIAILTTLFRNNRRIILDTLLILSLVVFLWYSLKNFSLDIVTTIVLLLGVWLIDAYIKNTYGFRNETLFADFSFAAFVFAGGQGINLINSNTPINESLIRMGVLIFILGCLWIGNLSICRGLNRRNTSNQHQSVFLVWILSLILATSSLVCALYPQVEGLI